MSRYAACAAIAVAAVAWIGMKWVGIDLPNPPMMQFYNLSLGWKGKCLLCRSAIAYMQCYLRWLADDMAKHP